MIRGGRQAKRKGGDRLETISLDHYLELLEGLYLGKRDAAFEDFALLFAEGVERFEEDKVLSRKGVAIFPGAEPLAWDDIELSDGRRLRLWLRDATEPTKVARMIQLLDQLVGNTEQLRRVATSDALTGALNRRGLEEWLAIRTKRFDEQAPCTIAFLDVDHFKQLNDERGHDQGDKALKAIVETLFEYASERDVVARYGGDEFVLVWDGMVFGELAREKIEQFATALSSRPYPLDVTVGVAGYPQHGETLGDVVKAADAAMYVGKRDGRRRVVTADDARLQTRAAACDEVPSQESEEETAVEKSGMFASPEPRQAYGAWAIARSYRDLPTEPK